MKVQIEGNLYLESDNLSYQIKEYSGVKNSEGKETFKVHGYFGSVQVAAKKLVQMKVKQSTATTLSELILDVKLIEKYIESKLTV